MSFTTSAPELTIDNSAKNIYLNGNPVIIDVDEVWKPLGDPLFRGFAKDGLKTYRKRNALMMMGTQSPADTLKSDIAETIIEQCPTKILLPNPNAQARAHRPVRKTWTSNHETAKDGRCGGRRELPRASAPAPI